MKILILGSVLFVLLLSSKKGVASDWLGTNFSVGIGWSLSVPTGHNLMNKTVFVVPVLEGEWRVLPFLSTSLSVAYTSGGERGITRDRYAGDLVDGYSRRNHSALTLMLRERWFMIGKRDFRLQPYLSLAGGAELSSYEISGEQINVSRIRGWSGIFESGLGVRYLLGTTKRFAVDFRCGYRYGGLSWKLMDVRRDNRISVALGLVMNL